MTSDIIQQRIDREHPDSLEHQENILCQIMQEIALSGLSRAGFFKQGVFHGGTCLRIVHGLPRYSEDLDFVLKRPRTDFNWTSYADCLEEEFSTFGVNLEIHDRLHAKAVKGTFIKDTSLGKLLDLRYNRHPGKKLVVKLEIDCQPPLGSKAQTRYLDFPTAFAITAQDLESGFAGKLHALLCRSYVKGRDWFDFTWYLSHKISPNLVLLESAIDQNGPWQGEKPSIDSDWVIQSLTKKVATIDFSQAKADVRRFLPKQQLRGLDVWSQDFFESRIASMVFR